jgi:chitin disaccharide deacetylase
MKQTPNPILKKLGYSNNDRVVILHADDIGMCHATLDAFSELDAAGAVSSGAVMVPCPWFLSTAEYARQHPETDFGIHLTINSEWKTYRWGPVSTKAIDSGLIDHEGFFYHKFEEAQEHGKPQAVAVELETQIRRAIDAGIRPTHVDSHMFTLIHPKFLDIYLKIAYSFGLPAMIARWSTEEWQQRGINAELAERAVKLIWTLEEQGYPMLDTTTGLKLDRFENRLEQAKQALTNLPGGLTHFYIHPCKDSPELRAITPDWVGRVADYQIFMGDRIKKHIANLGIQIIGYRQLLQMMPTNR